MTLSMMTPVIMTLVIMTPVIMTPVILTPVIMTPVIMTLSDLGLIQNIKKSVIPPAAQTMTKLALS